MSSFLASPLLLDLLGAVRCGTCLLVIGVQNPIHSILLLIRVFFLGSLLLFTLQREYFALLFLIVYVGAIVVLFLFIIRRLEIKRVNVARRFRDLFVYRHLVLALLALELLLLLSQEAFDLTPFLTASSLLPTVDSPFLTERNGTISWASLLHRTDPLRGLGGILFTEYRTTLFIAALLLFLAIVGAIVVTLVLYADPRAIDADPRLASPRTVKRQDPNHQARRHPVLVSAAFRV
jgi:NADH-quinone oxidoreductase subunit J